MRQALAIAMKSLPGSAFTVLRQIAQKHRLNVDVLVEAICGRPVHPGIDAQSVTGALTDLGVMLVDDIRHVLRDVPPMQMPQWRIDVGSNHGKLLDKHPYADELPAKLREHFNDESLPIAIELVADIAMLTVSHHGSTKPPRSVTVGDSLRQELRDLCGLEEGVHW